MVSRNVTNAVRFVLDECLPPIVRDRKTVLYPLFWLTYRGKNVRDYVDFKRRAYQMTEQEFSAAYADMHSIGTDRPTDLNQECIEYCLALIPDRPLTLLDVGCGRGFWVNLLAKERPQARVTGLDVLDHVPLDGATYVSGSAEHLPFPDRSFDIVFSSHVIEHVRDLEASARELKRVARDRLIVVTPRQRPYRYTFDMHLNFFWFDYELPRLFRLARYQLVKLRGDWVYVGQIPAQGRPADTSPDEASAPRG